MIIRPVSFGSLMVFTINDNRPKADVPTLMNISFNNNPSLKDYNLTDTVSFSEKIDGTVHNASSDFAKNLDKLYKSELPKGSKNVILTEVDFYVNPRETEKRYFLTAATDDDESKIHNILSKSNVFYSAKFNRKR